MSALLFGSISTVIDTSELQRTAFNKAFAEHGLDWNWSQDEYRTLLDSNGGADRISAYAGVREETVDAAAVHATKSTIFRELLQTSDVRPRPGVQESIDAARMAGMRVGLVTTTSPENVAAIVSALGGAVDFDVTVDAEKVDNPKPAPDAYLLALDVLGETAEHCVAVEDNPGGVTAAVEAGITCMAFPNENTMALDFSAANLRVERVEPQTVGDLVGAA